MGHSSVAFVVGSSAPFDGGASLPLFTNAATASASHSFVLRGWSALMTAGRACSWSVRTATARLLVCCARDVLAPIFFRLFLGPRCGPRAFRCTGGAQRVSGRRRRAPVGVLSACALCSSRRLLSVWAGVRAAANLAAVGGLEDRFCGVAQNSNTDFAAVQRPMRSSALWRRSALVAETARSKERVVGRLLYQLAEFRLGAELAL